MSRWSEAYKARALLCDSVDTVDNLAPEAGMPVVSVNTVNSVMSSQEVFADIERAAIQAEGIPVQRLRKRMGSWLQGND